MSIRTHRIFQHFKNWSIFMLFVMRFAETICHLPTDINFSINSNKSPLDCEEGPARRALNKQVLAINKLQNILTYHGDFQSWRDYTCCLVWRWGWKCSGRPSCRERWSSRPARLTTTFQRQPSISDPNTNHTASRHTDISSFHTLSIWNEWAKHYRRNIGLVNCWDSDL